MTALQAGDTSSLASKGFINTFMVGVNYGRHVPFGSMAGRFGGSNSVGATIGYKFNRNLIVQFGINTIFSGKVKENNAFDTMIGKSGYLVDINGNLAEVRIYERGYHWHFDIGKVFPLSYRDVNSGILLSAGGGFMQHKIKYTFQRTVLPQLEGDYGKGYDRLSNGFMFRGFAGYQKLDKKGMMNFYIGLEYLYGLTKSRRSFDYDTRYADTRARKDILLGLKFGILVTVNGRKAGTNRKDTGKLYE